MTYDPYRNLTGVSVGGNPLVTYGYRSGSNRLKSMTYANGTKQELTYDRFGNIRGEKWTKGSTVEAHYRFFYDASNQLVKTLDILNKKVYNMNRVGENVVSVEEYNAASVDSENFTATGLTLVGTMHYSFNSDGNQFRKKYVAADGSEQKYVFEFRDEQNVAVQLPTGAVSHAKTDHLGRKVFDEIQLGTGLMHRTFTYHEGKITDAHKENGKQVSEPTTTLVKEIQFHDGRTIAYEYDAEERITKVTDSVGGVTVYTYDALGQLLTETVDGKVINTMTYDGYGNIKTKNGVTYTYGNAKWKDLLTAYNGKAITYDANGNPTNYQGTAATWEKGRQLKTFGANSYKYNNDGIRIQKQTATEIHDYILDGSNIVKEIVSTTAHVQKYVNEYLYDLDGTVCGIKYNETAYYFYKNLQGDVIAITDANGAVVAQYTYDAWGVPTVKSDTSGCNIATLNPFRYRSYYYDTETKFYYLQSRYYNPETGRFINADDTHLLTNDHDNAVIALNLYCYCRNCIVSDVDNDGRTAGIASQMIKNFVLGFLGGMLGLYLANVTINLYKKDKEVYDKRDSWGAYVAEGLKSGLFSIFGSKLVLKISAVIGAAFVKQFVDLLFGKDGFNLSTLINDIIGGIISVLIFHFVSTAFSKVPKRASRSKLIEQLKNLMKKLTDYIMQRIKIKLNGIISFFKNPFVSRFSISYVKTIAGDLKKCFSA